MNEDHPNISLLKRLDPANLKTVADVLSKDFVWHYINPKLPEIQGDYHGFSGLSEFFRSLAGQTKGSFEEKPVSITPLGNELAITHVKDVMILEGKQMEIDAVVIWYIINGKIKEAWDVPILPSTKFSE